MQLRFGNDIFRREGLFTVDDFLGDAADQLHADDARALQGDIGLYLFQDAFDLPDIGLDVIRDIFHRFDGEGEAHALCLRVDDGDSRLIIRRLDIHQKPALEAAAEPILQPEHLSGRPVRREDDLLSGFIQGIERMEKFLLRLHFAGDELDIVHQQQVGLPVFFPEFAVPPGLDGVYQLVGKIVPFDIDYAVIGE